MIGISSKGNYSIAIIFDLARYYNKKIIKIGDVANNRSIPKSYLIQLFNKLKKSGLIESIRGNKGGYKLTKSPDKITLLEVLEKIDGEFEMFHNYQFNDAIKDVYKEIEENIKTQLSITFDRLIEMQDKIDNKIMYYI